MRIFTSLILIIATVQISAQSYQNIEAAEYDASQNRWLVTNGSSIIAQDEDGVLSFFGSGAANYGMETMNGTLFAIHNSNIKGYDLVTGDEVMSFPISGAGFLNGMGSDPATNRLWISDFGNNEILQLDVNDMSDPILTTAVANTGSTPNGVVHDAANNRVIFVSWGLNAAFKEIDLTDNSVSTLINSGLGNCDGIDIDDNGQFYVSSWSPTRITRYDNDFSNATIITAPGLSSPADISYGVEISTLGIANSGNETLTLVTFDPPSSVSEFNKNEYDLHVFPNPVVAGSRIAFSLDRALDVNIVVRDIEGRMVQELLSGSQPAGDHQLLLNGIEIPQGQYFLDFQTADEVYMTPFVVVR